MVDSQVDFTLKLQLDHLDDYIIKMQIKVACYIYETVCIVISN